MAHLENLTDFLPVPWYEAITRLRVDAPETARMEMAARARRDRLTRDGKLVILAVDHPARGANRVGDQPFRMGQRRELLGRTLRVLLQPGVDGLMATPDVMEDLFYLQHLIRQAGGPAFLDGKVLIGSMNRGGIAGSIFELDDTMTAYSPAAIQANRLDGGKLMFRLDLQEYDAARTVLACSRVITELARFDLPAFLEPLPVARKESGGWAVTMTPDALIHTVGIAQALGETSSRLWLKLPMVPQYVRVAQATTLPILVLGGEAHGSPERVLSDVASVMAAGSNVRGVLIGRNVLYPGDLDPAAMVRAVAAVVRGMAPAQAAGAFLAGDAGQIDVFGPLRLPEG